MYNRFKYRLRRMIDRARKLREHIRMRFFTNGYPRFYWPTTIQFVTQAFGINAWVYNKYNLPGHEGIDMRAPYDSEIYAVWWGEVTRNNYHNAYGNHIRIKHLIRGNEYESIYAHFPELSPLEIGDRVIRGQVIGLADSTGNSSGSHLHFGLKQFVGEKPDTEWQSKFNWPYDLIDPTPFFKELNGYA